MDSCVADFVNRMVSASPELTDVYRRHIADQGELLPHVLMGDVTRLVIASARSREPADWLANVLQQLDSGLLSGNSEVAELVAVSFVENLCGEDAAISILLPAMGEVLRREVKSICGV